MVVPLWVGGRLGLRHFFVTDGQKRLDSRLAYLIGQTDVTLQMVPCR